MFGELTDGDLDGLIQKIEDERKRIFGKLSKKDLEAPEEKLLSGMMTTVNGIQSQLLKLKKLRAKVR